MVGIASPVSAAPVLAAVASAQKTMTWTVYAHRTKVDAATGRYQFDCVGMTNYILGVAAPSANNAMRSALGISAGHTLARAHGAVLRRLAGGRQYALAPDPECDRHSRRRRDRGRASCAQQRGGHAMIAAGPATPLADAGYSVLVYDSTAVPPPHGAYDTRLTDPRAAKLASGKPSGLGSGTVEINRRLRRGTATAAVVRRRQQLRRATHIARALSAAPSS